MTSSGLPDRVARTSIGSTPAGAAQAEPAIADAGQRLPHVTIKGTVTSRLRQARQVARGENLLAKLRDGVRARRSDHRRVARDHRRGAPDLAHRAVGQEGKRLRRAGRAPGGVHSRLRAASRDAGTGAPGHRAGREGLAPIEPSSALSRRKPKATRDAWARSGRAKKSTSDVTERCGSDLRAQGRLSDASIRVDVRLLDRLMDLVGELVLARGPAVPGASGRRAIRRDDAG